MNSAHRDSEEIQKQRKARILQTDKYRKENFGDVFPLLNKVLQIMTNTLAVKNEQKIYIRRL